MRTKRGCSLLVCLLVAGGCGGDGGNEGGTGSASLYVTDYFGRPVGGAFVSLCGQESCADGYSDEEGNVAFNDIPAGRTQLCVFYAARGGGDCEYVRIVAGGTLTLDHQLKLSPYGGGTVAVLDARVDENGLSPDGRTLDIVIRVALSEPPPVGSWFNADPVRIDDCVARTGQELVDAGPQCIRGASGSDASYSSSGLTRPPVIQTIRQSAQPATVALLLDQSDAFFDFEEDNVEARLFTGKLFADRMLPDSALLLAAFAGDDPASGYTSLLPQTPVTFLPAGNPAPFLSKAETFQELDGLAGLSGGIAPLYAAILSSIDFVATHALPGTRRMLVVMANGRDDACTAPAQCAAARAEIAAQARENDVELVLRGDNYLADDLRALAVDASAPLIVLAGPSYEALDLVQDFIEGEVAVEDLRFRLTSDVPGAFHPGATVVGVMHGSTATNCPFGCSDFPLPFAVRVP